MNIRTLTTRRLRLLTSVLLMSVAGVSLSAQTEKTQGSVVYTLTDDDHYVATGLETGAEPTSLTIASQIDGLPVTEIGSHAFDHCTTLASVSLPEGLTAIGDYAFISCNALTSVTLPSSLTTVGLFAFYSCQSLSELSMSGTGLTLGVSAFADCTALRLVTISGSAPTLGNAAFNKVGTAADPALFRIDLARLDDFLALTSQVGAVLRFQEAYGYEAFQVVSDGLRYTYLPGIDGAPATYELAGIDAATLPLQAANNYLVQAPATVGTISVTSVAQTGAFAATGINDRLYAIDLRLLPLTSLAVSRSAGVFDGVGIHTLIYLPEGNTSDEDNVIVGGEVLHHINVRVDGADSLLTAPDILSGQATWLLCQQWGAQLFGQRIATDQAPLPMGDVATQRVWQVMFRSTADAALRQYRYANSGGTVALPALTDLGFEATDIVNFYIDSDVSKPFTATTTVGSDLQVFALPQASAITLSHTTIAVRMSMPLEQRTFQLSATVAPATADQSVTWATSDAAVATVTATGLLTVVGGGSATITCTSTDNPAVTATCAVSAVPLPQSISITPLEIRLSTVGEAAEAQLTATILPAEATQEFYWETTNDKIVTVDSTGHIKAVGVGKAFVHAYPKDYRSMYAICYVSVGSSVTAVTLSATQLSLKEGETAHVSATLTPSDALGGVTWSSSDEKVATVSGGDITALAPGNATITARATDNPSVSASLALTVLGKGASNTVDGLSYAITSLATATGGSNTVTLQGAPADRLASGQTIVVPTTVTIGGISFSVTAIAADAFATPTNNTIIYIPYGISYDGTADNVIRQQADGQNVCQRFVLTDGCDYNTQYSFTAEKLVYRRTLTARSEPYSICLPFATKSGWGGQKFYTLDHVEGDHLVMVSVPDRTEPYVPYLVIVDQTIEDLGDSQVWMPTANRNTAVYDGQYGLLGTMRGMSNADAAGMTAYVLSDDGRHWLSCAADPSLRVTALRSWLWHPGDSQPSSMSFTQYVAPPPTPPVTPPSAVNAVEADEVAAPYYDLQGRCVGTSLDGQPRGIYLRQGRKFVKH